MRQSLAFINNNKKKSFFKRAKNLSKRDVIEKIFDNFWILSHLLLAFLIVVFGKKYENLICSFSYQNS